MDIKKIQTPAQRVVSAFGGVHATTRAIQDVQPAGQEPIHWTTVSKWVNRKGRVPQRWHWMILEAAVHQGVRLSLDDLLEKPTQEEAP